MEFEDGRYRLASAPPAAEISPPSATVGILHLCELLHSRILLIGAGDLKTEEGTGLFFGEYYLCHSRVMLATCRLPG